MRGKGIARFSPTIICLIAFGWIAVPRPASGQG